MRLSLHLRGYGKRWEVMMKKGDLVQIKYRGKKPQKFACIVLSVHCSGDAANVLTRVGPMIFLTRDLKRIVSESR